MSRADSPPPFQDFSAKRVRAPEKGSLPKIDVQITSQVTAAPVPIQTQTPKEGQYGWFWEEISPSLSEMGPGRLAAALAHVTQAPAGQAIDVMRLQELQEIATAHHRDILLATVGRQVSPALVLAVIAVESRGKSDAVSRAGAEGLMQLMPDTAKRFDVSNAQDAGENIRGGVAFLDFLIERFEHDPVLVLAGYNAGEGAVRAAGGVPDYAETRDYVPKVLATYAVARGLCKTPPQLISDGCVFITR